MTEPSNSVTTPASAASSAPAGSNQHNSKIAAPKDRACPYCHVNFTSSSLGRHLDLYIKEKNPKPPDGIHNVDEIRKSRSGITRRQARSAKKHGRSDGSGDSHQNGRLTESASPGNSQSDRRPGMGQMAFRSLFNTPHWTSTGVITDSDANQQLMTGDMPMASTPGGTSNGIDPFVRRKWAEERERGRAAELALQELVDSIKAASSQRNIPEPFDFDFFSCSFPELCLRILSAPATLDRPSFITDNSSWPIDPPDEAAYKAMQQKILEKIVEWRKTYHPPNYNRKRRRSDENPDLPAICNDPEQLEPNPLYQNHLTNAWNAWASQPLMKKAPEYHMWAMRLYALEKREHSATKQRLEYLETELNRARIDNARLTECQMPREWLHTPASQLPLAKLAADKVERELRGGGLDAEKLIAKWRPRVQAAKSTTKTNDGQEQNQRSRLAMIGPSGVPRGQQRQMPIHETTYDRQIVTDEEEDDDEGDDEEAEGEDEEYDEDEDGDERFEEAAEAMEDANGTINPSLRNQIGSLGTA